MADCHQSSHLNWFERFISDFQYGHQVTFIEKATIHSDQIFSSQRAFLLCWHLWNYQSEELNFVCTFLWWSHHILFKSLGFGGKIIILRRYVRLRVEILSKIIITVVYCKNVLNSTFFLADLETLWKSKFLVSYLLTLLASLFTLINAVNVERQYWQLLFVIYSGCSLHIQVSYKTLFWMAAPCMVVVVVGNSVDGAGLSDPAAVWCE